MPTRTASRPLPADPSTAHVTSPVTSPRPGVTVEALRQFVEAETEPMTVPLVPEIDLHLAKSARNIFVAADDLMDGSLGSRPYWAFAWPGGQGLARLILDEPGLVAGKTVLDLGSGSGIGAIAALKAGAKSALAADIDPMADVAAQLNGVLNRVDLQTTTKDLLGTEYQADVMLIGDLVYEPDLLIRVGAFIEAAQKRGALILYGDRTSARRPKSQFQLIREYESPLIPALVDDFIERARVFRLG